MSNGIDCVRVNSAADEDCDHAVDSFDIRDRRDVAVPDGAHGDKNIVEREKVLDGPLFRGDLLVVEPGHGGVRIGLLVARYGVEPATHEMRDEKYLGDEFEEVPGGRVPLGELVMLVDDGVGPLELGYADEEREVEHLRGELVDEERSKCVEEVDPEIVREIVTKDWSPVFHDISLLVVARVEIDKDFEGEEDEGCDVEKPEFYAVLEAEAEGGYDGEFVEFDEAEEEEELLPDNYLDPVRGDDLDLAEGSPKEPEDGGLWPGLIRGLAVLDPDVGATLIADESEMVLVEFGLVPVAGEAFQVFDKLSDDFGFFHLSPDLFEYVFVFELLAVFPLVRRRGEHNISSETLLVLIRRVILAFVDEFSTEAGFFRFWYPFLTSAIHETRGFFDFESKALFPAREDRLSVRRRENSTSRRV